MKDLTQAAKTSATLQRDYVIDSVRVTKAIRIVESHSITRLPSGNYQVASEADANHFYQVNLKARSCNCPDFRRQHEIDSVCKHFHAVQIYLALPEKLAPTAWTELPNFIENFLMEGA